MSGAVNAFYGAAASRFLSDPLENVVGALTTRSSLLFRGLASEQTISWQRQVPLLKRALAAMPDVGEWSVLLEYSLHRLGKRPDAVVLLPGVIAVVEFKMGPATTRHTAEHVAQVEDYALCIRDFHPAARGIPIVPIACAECAPRVAASNPRLTDGVASVILANGADLDQALKKASSFGAQKAPSIRWEAFDEGGYNPTPTIVEAARSLYQGHSVREIGRRDADGDALARTAGRLRHWVTEAREKQQRTICFLTGTPGAGKSLLGLNLVLSEGAGRVFGEPAAMLTGNRPLVHVLKSALVNDARKKGDFKHAKRALDGALQTLLDYLKAHVSPSAPPPPEHILVFDEAQRAWDEETGQRLLRRPRSEPELFLEILDRLPWACLVCLVGPGQEINRGEGGMRLWGAALDREASEGHHWHIVAPSVSDLHTSQYVEIDPALHLSGGLRSYRNERHGEWVDALLAGQIDRAASLATEMTLPPAFITRSLVRIRSWLEERRRGGRRPGLLASSAATRLVAEGLPRPPMSRELDAIENWFLTSWPDFRSSDSLEVPLSEFGCQGLELDYAGLCWGGDLIWSRQQSEWVPRRMHGPNWQTLQQEEDKAQYRLNAYRVLLTRAREGICILVPRGSNADVTRAESQFDEIATALQAAGCRVLD